MSVSKKPFSAVVCCMFLAAVCLFTGVNAAQAETVVINGPFGDVPLGSQATSAIQVNAPATSWVRLTGMTFASGASSQFSVNTVLPEAGLYLAPGASTAIEVAFTPVTAGPVSATLVISTLSASGWTTVPGEIHLNLTGTGLEPEAAHADADRVSDLQGLLGFFDSAVAAGTLEGKGKGKSAKKRLKSVRNMIRSVDKKLKKDRPKKACRQIRAISKKMASHLQGEATGELADRLKSLAADLGCK